ncbi:MAG: IPT/TIG domain-containing protein, partial [Pseudomonadota bacterium]
MKQQTQMIALLFLLATMSCSKGTRVFSFKQSGITPASAMKIETIKPVAAKPGEVVTITGQALTRQSQVKIGDTIVEFTESNGTMAKFIMPETPRAGAFKITVGRYNDPTGTVEGPAKYMLSDNAGDDYPIYMAKAAEICSPIGFRDANGDLQVGSKDCAAVTVNDCAADGEVGCKTT